MEISEKNQVIIKSFLEAWWNDMIFQASQTVLDASLPPVGKDFLYDQPFGHELREMAAATEGLTERNDDSAMEIMDIVQNLCEWMFARPGMPSQYTIPTAFWGTPIGDIALRAHLWARGDELVTMTAASELCGRSIGDISNMVRRGRLTGYPDVDENNPQRRTRLLKSEIDSLPPKREKRL